MACEAPRKAYQAAPGGPLSFNRPIAGNAGIDYRTYTIPCGTCILCRNEQARQQAIRIYHESQMHQEGAFLTMTYDEEHLPEFSSLSTEDKANEWQRPQDRHHLSKFWKRMRKAFGKMRYYSVGEYGDQTQRPHYHACIFGHAFVQGRTIVRRTPSLLWENPRVTEAWGQGQVRIGALNFRTARYTASYVTKKLRSKQQYVRLEEDTGELIPLVQPKAYMSRNLGRSWWDQYRHQVSAHDYVIIDGKRQKPPKAYDRWLKERSELALEMIKEERQKHTEPKTDEQLHARAENARARNKLKSKAI